jgi:hypothetical protein
MSNKLKVSLLGFLKAFGLLSMLSLSGCAIKSDPQAAPKTDPQIVAFSGAYFAILDGRVYAGGKNIFGRLGSSGSIAHYFTEINELSDKNIIGVAAGEFHTLALTKEGKVYATGSNEFGQLGLGDESERGSFAQIASLKDKSIIAIAAGSHHSFVIDSDRKVYATGHNYYGQLGLGVRGVGAKRDAFTEVASLNGKNIIAIAAGVYHSLALSENGKVYAAGSNELRKLGLDGDDDRDAFTEVASLNGKNIIALAAGYNDSFALSKEGKLYATRYYQDDQDALGDGKNKTGKGAFIEVAPLSDKHIKAIVSGRYHHLALTKEGKVYAVGNNWNGQLGLGDTKRRDAFTEVASLNGKNIVAIAASIRDSIVIANDGKFYSPRGKYDREEEDRGDAYTFVLIPNTPNADNNNSAAQK